MKNPNIRLPWPRLDAWLSDRKHFARVVIVLGALIIVLGVVALLLNAACNAEMRLP